jgi:Family of unknown function (DUF5990)
VVGGSSRTGGYSPLTPFGRQAAERLEPFGNLFGLAGRRGSVARRGGAAYGRIVRIVITGRRLPGRQCGPYANVHVGLQVGSRPDGLVPGDAPAAQWEADVRVVEVDGVRDFHGPAVHGRRGERFLYLTWGELAGSEFAMFRRAKLMLDDVPAGSERVVVEVDLTDPDGMPCCARLRPPAVRWAAA